MRRLAGLALVPAVLLPALLVVSMPVLFGEGDRRDHTRASHPDIPPIAMGAYQAAAATVAAEQVTPPCRPSWALLAAIGRVETDHGRHGGASLAADATATPPILGPVLDGSLTGTRVVADSDGGALDGDARFDRAVGPMQFLPQTWWTHARDGNADGHEDPQNLADAAAAAGVLLCAAATGGDLAARSVVRRAVLGYNRSTTYVDDVLRWMDTYLAEVQQAMPGHDGTGPIACPVLPPVHFIDSWHFPRSGGRVHKGQDMFAAEGTPLVALADAVVTDIGHHRGLGGNVVWLVTTEGHTWYYAHLDAFAPGLAVGQQLRRGDPLGTVGRTGNARTTPPHLHIQWRPTGRRGPDVNPFALLSAACPGHQTPG